MMPARLSLLALLWAAPIIAQTTPPTASIEVDEDPGSAPEPTTTAPTTTAPTTTAPTTTAPTTTAPTTTAPTTTAPQAEPALVDGWSIVQNLSDRRLPNGTPTAELCGYERDVRVRRPNLDGGLDETPATLQVPCSTVDGAIVAGTPRLKLPPPFGNAGGANAPAASTGLSLGVQGALTVEAITPAFTVLDAAVRNCHQELGGPAAELVGRVVVDGVGTVGEVNAQSGNAVGSTLAACILDVLRTAKVPAPSDGQPAVISVAYSLSQTGSGGLISAVAAAAALPPCKAGEAPALANGVSSCREAPVARPCHPGEEPLRADQLSPGQLACRPLDDERGVPFLKGELTKLGDVQLVNARTSFGVGLGLTVIDDVYFAVARPDINLRFGNFSLGLGAPLRFEVLNLKNVDVFGGDPLGDATANLGRFRTEDWDQVEDFVRPLRYVTYGKKEDNLYIDLNRVHASTIGHGQLVRRYAPNLDIDEDNLFAQVDGYGDLGGVEMMAGPFPIPRLMGGLAFIKPIGIFNALRGLGETPVNDATATSPPESSALDTLAHSWSIGFSYVTDLNSPTGLDGRNNPADGRPQLTVDNANQLLWRNKNNPVGDVVQGVGIDTEVKVLKLEHVDIKVYGDYSHLFFPTDSSDANAFGAFSGGGVAAGGLLRVSFGETPVRKIEDEDEETRAGRKPREKRAAHAFRLRLEGRTFAPTYLPSYWNTMYEVDRFQFGFNDNRVGLPTKIRYLADQAQDPWRVGYYTELSYAWVDAVGVTAVFEDAYPIGGDDLVRGKNLALHVETQGLGFLQLFGSYHFRNFEAQDFSRVFSFNSDNEILFVGGRLQILPILFLNVGAQRAFRVGFDDDDVLAPNDKGLRFTSVGLQNVWAYGADLELGWQF